jgi:uncharacterized membrane protein YbaN (DUF454 family)
MKLRKYTYIVLGWLSFAIGFLGMFVPLLPTVVFWIVAVWLWSRGAPELMQKVYDNAKYGSQIEAFMLHGVVSRKGKIAAVVSMSISYILFQFFAKPAFMTGAGVAIVLSVIAIWLVTRPEQPKQDP